MLSKSFLDKNFTALYLLGLIVGLGFAFVYADNQILLGDQMQMIEKGYLGAYADVWLNFGNGASAVGNVPGSLSTWLVAGPLLVWDSPWAPVLLLFAMRIASLFLLDSVLKQIFDKPMRLAFLALYWLNPWLLYDSLLYNPSYLCFFASLHLWSAFKMREGKSFIYTFLHILSIGLAMQLHYSWPVLAVLSLYMFYREMGKVSWVGFTAALVVLMVSLIPYSQEYLANDELSRDDSDRYIGYGLVHVYPVLKALLYWVRYASLLFSNKVIAYSEFHWFTSIEFLRIAALYLWKGIIFLIGGLSVVLSAKVSWDWWKSIKNDIKRVPNTPVVKDKAQWLKLYAFGAVIGVLVSAALSPITFSYWHLILIYPFALIPMIFAIQRYSESHGHLVAKIAPVVVGYLLVINVLASHDSIKYSYTVSFSDQVNQYLLETPKKYKLDQRDAFKGLL
ncbi:3-deoxy-D-manno-octulosonic acid transferase [Vibrio sp. 10N.261.51.F12]|uniref:3-deoxy-D-manno-octulosonic acid transferase n=1 Tax=Vibrio sp. 10N.261.51.F12 TaxID=3229679 RepID=UPI003553ABD4